MSSRYTTVGRQYSETEVAGDIPACRWVQLACQRRLNELARFKDKPAAIINWRVLSTTISITAF